LEINAYAVINRILVVVGIITNWLYCSSTELSLHQQSVSALRQSAGGRSFRTQETSTLEDPDQLPADAPSRNMALHLYIVE
jgi:hypothetical protein